MNIPTYPKTTKFVAIGISVVTENMPIFVRISSPKLLR
jgi:hypothetical protein